VLHEVTAGEAGLLVMLFPHLAGLDIVHAEDLGDAVRITARTRTASLACRGCGEVSARVHDRYRRRLADLACGGRPVQVVLEVRRFRCGRLACPVATFAEQVPGLTSWYRRRTASLHAVLEKVALALAGRAGSRLAAVLGVLVSGHTLIRLVRALPDPQAGPVAVLGVDDVAKRKGHSYATVVMDMDSHRLIDMLPDREAGTFADWLRAHPGTGVVCRDRGGAYARGARAAAPVAVQVADRFHLWQDLAGAVEKTVLACLAALLTQDPDAAASPDAPAEPDGFRDAHGHERTLVAGQRERYAAVRKLRAEGCSIRQTARRLGLGTRTVLRYDHAASAGELLVKATRRPSILDPFKPYLNQRWNEGITSAAALHREIRARGWAGSAGTVENYLRQFRTADGRATPASRPSILDPFKPYLNQRRNQGITSPAALHREIRARGWAGSAGTVENYLRQFRTADGPDRAQPQLTAPHTPPPPKPRQVTRWIMTRPDHLSSGDAAALARLLDASPRLAAAAGHVRSFATMMTRRQGLLALQDWLTQVEADDQPQLHSFARGIRRDQEAVTAGLALPYSSGALEGRNCKIKYLKRLMYGRANFDLLRKMALLN
jgi:transposase